MKKCKVLVLMLVFCLIMTGLPTTFAKAEETATNAKTVATKDILGVWDGYYMGSDSNNLVKRGFCVNIVSCDPSNLVYGVATVKPYGASSGITVNYYFEGSFDPSTLTLKFCGKDTILGTSDFSFSEFTAVLNPETKEFNGSFTDDKDRTLYLAKDEEESNHPISKDILKDSWTGYYMGRADQTKVKRIITFDIKSVKADSTLSGTAKVEAVPGEIDRQELQYNFSGFYNLANGQVIIRGTDFITKNKNFSFAYFFGTVNADTGEIAGIDGLNDIYDMLSDVKFNVYNDVYVMDPGTKFSSKEANYEVLTNGKTKTVAYIGTNDDTKTGLTIPATVNAFGVNYKVTEISADALKNCTALKKVNIGANITTIKDSAFLNCSSLKSITIKSKSVKKICKSAFTGIADAAVFNVPKAQYTAYSKLLKKTDVGYKKTWSFKRK